jgi:glyoxylase-like metal-dependent hydrolase (beta-lactamase superfamily II)
VGDVKVTAVVELTMPLPLGDFVGYDRAELVQDQDWLAPFILPGERHPIVVQAFLVEAAGAKIIVDTCLGNDRSYRIPAPTLHTAFLADLAAAGAPADAVDIVVCTHLHIDHVGWNTRLLDRRWVPTFKNARYLFGRVEYEHWSEHHSDVVELEDTVAPVLEAGLHQLVDMDQRITDEVSLQPSPGHTPGHVSVRISSAGEEALITGDMVHHPMQLIRPDWHSQADGDPDLAECTRRSIFERAAADGLLLIGSHFAPPTAGRVVANGHAWSLGATAAKSV